MQIGAYLDGIYTTPDEPIAKGILDCVSHEEAQSYRLTLSNVLSLMKQSLPGDVPLTKFDHSYLSRVISQFSPTIEEQRRQRLILEAILRIARTSYDIDSIRVPPLIATRRDEPALAPQVLLHTNTAVALYRYLKADLNFPAILTNEALEIGRLASVLFFLEGFPDLSGLLDAINSYKTFYVRNVILLEPIKSDSDERYVIDLYTATLFNLLKHKRKSNLRFGRLLNSKKQLLGCVKDYLAFVSDEEIQTVSESMLINYRNIFWSNHFSPVEAKFYLQRFKSQTLPESVFIRVLANKASSRQSLNIATEVDLTVNNHQQILAKKNNLLSDNYHTVAQTESLVNELLKMVRKPDEINLSDWERAQFSNELAKNKHKAHQVVINIVSNMLKREVYQQNYYALFVGYYIIHLLRKGGTRKSTLSFKTIRDYATAPLHAFICIFNDLVIQRLNEVSLIEKLNKVAELMPPTKKGYLYYLALYIQNLELVDDFSASGINSKSVAGRVNANIVTVQQIECLLTQLRCAGEFYTDAILLICLGFYSAARRAEVRNIRVSDFELFQTRCEWQISLKIVPTKERGLKTRAGTRTLNLNAFWPKEWLNLLANKLVLARSSGISKSDLLFDSEIDEQFAFVSRLLRTYLQDDAFVFHNLRHSFVCWQYFRLVLQPSLKQSDYSSSQCLDHPYFSTEACLFTRQKLGLGTITRKEVYTLSHLVGHSDPLVTFGSYLHLRDLYLHLLVKKDFSLTQKALSRLVSRAKLNTEAQLLCPAEAITCDSNRDKQALNISPMPGLKACTPLSFCLEDLKHVTFLPSLHQLEIGLNFIGKMQSDEHLILNEGERNIELEGRWLQKLQLSCTEVHKNYPKRGRKLPVMPDIPRSSRQLRSDKKLSASRVLFEKLSKNAQALLDSGTYDDVSIVANLQSLEGLLINQEWELQFTDPAACSRFFRFVKKILPADVDIAATIYDPGVALDDLSTDSIYARWFMALAELDIKPQLMDMDPVRCADYWNKNLSHGLLWAYFVITKYDDTPRHSFDIHPHISARKASIVMHFLHFLLVACKTRIQLSNHRFN